MTKTGVAPKRRIVEVAAGSPSVRASAVQKCSFSVGAEACGSVVAQQQCDALADLALVDPIDAAATRRAAQRRLAFLRHELHGAGAVFADVRDQLECVVRRHAEALTPPPQNLVVVGQQAPQEWFDHRVRVALRQQRHRHRQRVGRGRRQPGGFVVETQRVAFAVAPQPPHALAVG